MMEFTHCPEDPRDRDHPHGVEDFLRIRFQLRPLEPISESELPVKLPGNPSRPARPKATGRIPLSDQASTSDVHTNTREEAQDDRLPRR